MSNDVFDLGEPAEDESNESSSANDGESADTANNNGDANNAESVDNASNANTQKNTSSASDGGSNSEADPTRTPAYDTDYQSTQRTIGVRDETWTDVTDLLEDAQAYSKLDGYREVTKLETYEALFQHLLKDTDTDAKDIASAIQTARHRAHDET